MHASNDGHQDCFIDKSVCKQSVDELWRSSSDLDGDLNFQDLKQFLGAKLGVQSI